MSSGFNLKRSFLLCLVASLSWQVFALENCETLFLKPSNKIVTQPLVDYITDLQIDKDLEDLLIPKSAIKDTLARENLSLIGAARQFGVTSVWLDVAASFVGVYFLARQPIKAFPVIAENSTRILTGLRAGRALREVEMAESQMATAASALMTWGTSFVASTAYMSSSIYLKGTCVYYSCPDNIVTHITESQEIAFLQSYTFLKIEQEIGKPKALRFYSLIKLLRADQYKTDEIFGQMQKFIDTIDPRDSGKFRTFLTVVQALSGAYQINLALKDYLIKSGRLL